MEISCACVCFLKPLILRTVFVFILGMELNFKSIHIQHGKGSLSAAFYF